MIEYKKIRIRKKDIDTKESNYYLKQLISLSKLWAKEKICLSYRANSKQDYLDKDIYIAMDGDKIVGYGFGHISKLRKKTTYNNIGDKSFVLDEIYVRKDYRNQEVGQILFRNIEEDVRQKVDLISIVAASDNYKELLRFYIEILGMSFNYAFLSKRVKKR